MEQSTFSETDINSDKKFLVFYGSRRFITVSHVSAMDYSKPHESIPDTYTPFTRYILILSSQPGYAIYSKCSLPSNFSD